MNIEIATPLPSTLNPIYSPIHPLATYCSICVRELRCHKRIFIISKNLNPEVFKCVGIMLQLLLKTIYYNARRPELHQGRSDFLLEGMVVTKVIGYFCVISIPAGITKLGIIKVYKNCQEINVLSGD